MNLKQFKKYIKYFGYLITIFCFYFIFKQIQKVDIDFKLIKNQKIITLYSFLFLIIQVLIIFLVGYGWKIILEFVSKKKIEMKEIIPIHLKSNIAKYLPGNVFEFVARNVLSTRFGISQQSVFFSSIIESALSIINFLIILLILISFNKIDISNVKINLEQIKLYLPILFTLGIIVSFFIIIEIKKNHGNLYDAFRYLSIRSLFQYLLITNSIILISSLMFYWIVHLIGSNTVISSSLLEISGIYLMSYFAGYIMPGAPGGLGVRESLLILLFQNKIPSQVVILSAALIRIIQITGDGIGYFISKKIK